jgi:hypothetical protein
MTLESASEMYAVSRYIQNYFIAGLTTASAGVTSVRNLNSAAPAASVA